jgi:hypothetical protein
LKPTYFLKVKIIDVFLIIVSRACLLPYPILATIGIVATLALARDQGKGVARLRAYK